jgi:hypothetical protein
VRAVIIGLGMLMLVYPAGAVLLNLLIEHPSRDAAAWRFLAPIFSGILWLLPGFTTGYLARRSPLMHGLLLGIGSVFLVLLALGILELIFRYSDSLPTQHVIGFLIPLFIGPCLGAFIGHYVANRTKAP